MTDDTSQVDYKYCKYCKYYHSYQTPEGKQSLCAVNPSLLNNAINCGDYDQVDNIDEIEKESNLPEPDWLNDYYVPLHNVFNTSASLLESIEYKPEGRPRQAESKQSFYGVNLSLLGDAIECKDYDDNDLSLEDQIFIKIVNLAESVNSLFSIRYQDPRTSSICQVPSPLELLDYE